MRHLFVPACICVMAWSNATGSDSGMTLDEFYSVPKRENKAAAPVAASEPRYVEPVRADMQVDMSGAEIAREAPITGVEATGDQAAALPIPLPPIPKPVVHRTHREICDTLTKAAQSNDLPIPFFISLLFQESGFQPEIVSSAGAQGIAQFMPETAASMGLQNPFDPLQAIPASARLLRNLVSQFGNLGLAAAAYNAGPKRVQDWLEKRIAKEPDAKTAAAKKLGKKDEARIKLPSETENYVKIITGHPAESWKRASATQPSQRLPRRAPCQEAAGLYASYGPDTIPLPMPSPRTQLAAAAPAKGVADAAGHSGKAADKRVSQQLAARKRKDAKPQLEKIAQR